MKPLLLRCAVLVFLLDLLLLTSQSYAVITLPQFSSWKLVDKVNVNFESYHPQGMIKVGDDFFLSTVDWKRYKGFLIKFNLEKDYKNAFQIRESSRIELTEGARYHPGGVDYDTVEEKLWLPVSEYASKTSTSLYRIDPKTFLSEKITEFKDHLGTLIFDPFHDLLHAFNWGSKKIYSFQTKNFYEKPVALPPFKNSDYSYQDCKGLDRGYALCTGVKGLIYRSGALDLIRYKDDHFEMIYRIEVPRIKKNGERAGVLYPFSPALTQNPMTFELLDNNKIKLYFMPNDDKNSKLLIYETHLKI